MTENTYENMIRAAIGANGNLKRHNMAHVDVSLVNVGTTSFFENELLNIVRTSLNKHNPSFAIGSVTENPNFARKYADEKERILNNLQDDILLAEVQWKANMMRMEQQSAEKTAIILDRGDTLFDARTDAEDAILRYHHQQVESLGIITRSRVRFLTEGCPYNEGMIIVFANGDMTGADYSKSLQLYVKNLRDNLGEGYNVAYFVSDALGESEIEWVREKIQATRKETQTGL